jgi:hypothetical protein
MPSCTYNLFVMNLTDNTPEIDALFDAWDNLKSGGIKEEEEEEEEEKKKIKEEGKELLLLPPIKEEKAKGGYELRYQVLWVRHGEVIRAYQQWLRDLPPHSLPLSDPHACSYACSHDSYGDVYFCSSSGNMHVCTRSKCTNLVRMFEGSACSITSKMFTLPLDCRLHSRSVDLSSFEHSKAYKDEARAAKKPRKKRRKPEEAKEFKAPTRVSVTAPSKSPSLLKTVIRKRRAKMDDMNTLGASATTCIRRVFSVIRKDPPPDVVAQVANTCCKLWKMIASSAPFNRQCTSYRFETHCHIVMWASINGMQVNGEGGGKITVIEKEEWLKKHLPVRQFLSTWLGVPQGKYTDAEKFLKRCINALNSGNKLSVLVATSTARTKVPVGAVIPLTRKRKR